METRDRNLEKKIGLLIARYLESRHSTSEIDWNRFLSPFLQCFFDYFGTSTQRPMNPTELASRQNVPHGNNDIITDLETESGHHELVTRGICAEPDWDKISVAEPTKAYINKYIFPYSDNSGIAFLAFHSRWEKLAFYLASRMDIKTCRLDWCNEGPIKPWARERSELLKALSALLDSDTRGLAITLSCALPSIYLENFEYYLKKTRSEATRLENVRVIYFIRHFLFNPTFLLLLSLRSIGTSKMLVTFQHGAGYGQISPTWSERAEKAVATHFLTWGYRYDEKDVPFFSQRFRRPLSAPWSRSPKEASTLVVLPLLFRHDQLDGIESSFRLLAQLPQTVKPFSLRFDPRETNQDSILQKLEENGVEAKVDTSKSSLLAAARQYSKVIFITPFATGFLELLAHHIYPYLVFNSEDFEIRSESKDSYGALHSQDIWVDSKNVDSADLSRPASYGQRAAWRAFQQRFARTSFIPELQLIHYLVKCSQLAQLSSPRKT